MKSPMLGSMLLLSALFTQLPHVALADTPTTPTPQGAAAPAKDKNNLSDADLDQLEKDLENPDTRLAATSRLFGFAMGNLSHIGAKRMARMHRATELSRKHVEPETVSAALASSDPTLQWWGITFWHYGADKALSAKHLTPHFPAPEKMTPPEKVWHDLMPQVQKLALNSVHATKAVDALCASAPEENRAFLEALIPQEGNPEPILHILERLRTTHGYIERDKTYSAEVLRRLQSPDMATRTTTLHAITYVPGVPVGVMFKPHFSDEVRQRVEELKQSADPQEKEAAERAAQDLP